MTIRATAGFNFLRYDPGNPEFPTLPDGVIVPHVLDYQTGGGDKRTRQAYSSSTKFIAASAPANDSQRFAGWQTETTWINPTVVDFGVIPTPVQRTVTLYNARTVPIEVTALSLPTGVTLVSPSLPVTLTPYDGAAFIIEAGITGDNSFDETSTFTTSVGDSPFRTLGRRVFSLTVIPQAPMSETLQFRTDLLRSTDGTEKAYSLLQAPNAMVDYKVYFTDDLERIRFKNNFIAGESALVVAGQKWYEARLLSLAAQTTDTTLALNTNLANASWEVGGPISIVREDGTETSHILDSTSIQPDPLYEKTAIHLKFDGSNGQQTDIDYSPQANLVTFVGADAQISTAQSVFGGSSYTAPTSTQGIRVAYDPTIVFGSKDWTIDCWLRPNASVIANGAVWLSRWGDGGGFSWRLGVDRTNLTGFYFVYRRTSGYTTQYFPFPSPVWKVDEWVYFSLERFGGELIAYINGVEFSRAAMTHTTIQITGGTEENTPTGVGKFDIGSGTWRGYMDDVRITVDLARHAGTNFTPPTAPHPALVDSYLELQLNDQVGTAAPVGSRVMPVGLGYVSRFPTYSTYQDNLETADYTLTFNQEADFGALDPSFPTLSNALLSPVVETPILEACNEISGRVKRSQIQRYEDRLESGLSNRQAFTVFPFSDNVQEYMITLNSEDEVWKWRTFIHYLRGSYNDFYVPTFTDDIPGVTTAASNVFVAQDTDLSLLFGATPADRRNAIRLQYADGTILYRIITDVVDNGATEQITVSSSVNVGNPKISYLQRARILGDTVSFTHNRTDYVTLRFRYRTLTE